MISVQKRQRLRKAGMIISPELRLSPEMPEKAKAEGKGCTGFLSRLLDNAIKDPELVMKSLQKGR